MPPMDAKIEALLCERCRPIMAAALEYETAQATARAKRDALNARIAAHDPTAKRVGSAARRAIGIEYDANPLDAPLPTRADAIATARQSIGLASGKGRPGSPRASGPDNPGWKNIPEAEIMRTIRGEVSPRALADKLKVGTGVIHSRVNLMIGPPDCPERWRHGVGFFRQGKPAIDLLRQVKGLRLPASQPPPPPSSGPKRKLPLKMGGPKPKRLKVGGRGNAAPVIADADLQRLIDKRTSSNALARKYKCGMSTVYKQLKLYQQHQHQPRQGTLPAVTAGKITDDELDDIVAGNLSVPLVAHRHRVSTAAVAARVQQYRAENGKIDRVLANVNPAAVVAHAGANGTQSDSTEA